MQCACFQLKFKRKNRQNTGRFCGKAYSSWCAVFIQTLKLGLTIFITNWKNCLTPIRSLSSWADFCVPELIIEFLSWSLSSWADHWVPELIIVFLSWLLYSWADHCDPELIIEFLSWSLCPWADYCIPELIIVTLSWSLSSWADYCVHCLLNATISLVSML